MRVPMSLASQKRLIKTYRRAVTDCETLRDHERRVESAKTYTNDFQRQDARDDTNRLWSTILNTLEICLKWAEKDYPEAARAINNSEESHA